MKVPTDLFERIAEILDYECQMHDSNCSSVGLHPRPGWCCDCQRDKKIAKVALMISRLLKDTESMPTTFDELVTEHGKEVVKDWLKAMLD